MGVVECDPPANKRENMKFSGLRIAGFIDSMKWTGDSIPKVRKPEDGGNMNHIDRGLELPRRVN